MVDLGNGRMGERRVNYFLGGGGKLHIKVASKCATHTDCMYGQKSGFGVLNLGFFCLRATNPSVDGYVAIISAYTYTGCPHTLAQKINQFPAQSAALGVRPCPKIAPCGRKEG